MVKKLATFMVLVGLLNVVANAEELIPDTPETEVQTYQVEEIRFNVTVPASLPIHVESDGTVTVASDLAIVNNSTHPVKVSCIVVHMTNGWGLLNPVEDIAKLAPGGKGFQLEILGNQVDETGILTNPENAIIGVGESLPIEYNAWVQTQIDGLYEPMASVEFTVDWVEAPTPQEIPKEIPTDASDPSTLELLDEEIQGPDGVYNPETDGEYTEVPIISGVVDTEQSTDDTSDELVTPDQNEVTQPSLEAEQEENVGEAVDIQTEIQPEVEMEQGIEVHKQGEPLDNTDDTLVDGDLDQTDTASEPDSLEVTTEDSGSLDVIDSE